MGLFDKIVAENPQYDVIRNITKDIHIHDYQLPVLYTYRNLPQKMKEFEEGSNYFKINNECFYIDDSVTEQDIINQVKSGNAVNSLLKFTGASKRCEIVYDLDKVFDRASYENAKKYNKRIVQPINYFERENIEIRELNKSDKDIALQLYDLWCNQKLSDEKLFKIMFPVARYRNCLDYAIQGKLPELKAIGCFMQDKLLGFRIVSISGEYCYDLAYITDREQTLCANFSERFNVSILKWLRDNYSVRYFNCGLAEGSLKKFKQHLPNYEVIYYRYTKSSIK